MGTQAFVLVYMIIAKIFFTILEIMFFGGAIGSALVVLLTSIDDVRELREAKEPEPRTMSALQHSEAL
jgi:hypothetical protein